MKKTPSALHKYVEKQALKRAQPMVPPILPWVLDGSGSILDFGCGLGHIACLLSEKSNRQMTYLDVKRFPYACATVELFDGKSIPYPNLTFTTTLIIFVLHHVPDPAKSIREVMRVTNKEIIICEDLIRTKKEMVAEVVKDTVANYFFPHMTMKYKYEKDWEKLFTRLGVKISDKTYFNSRYLFRFDHVAWRLSLV
jgi:ubiquinone/menaquinone biosynthesis C-methylase UbiE